MNSYLSLPTVALPLADIVGPYGIMPFLIPLAGMALALVALIAGTLDKMQKRRLRHELLRVALEKGQPLPPELLEEAPRRRSRDDRRSGLVNIAIGVGVYLLFRAIAVWPGLEWIGVVPVLIGGALLLNWAIERREGGDRS
jgi:hypothetical protein